MRMNYIVSSIILGLVCSVNAKEIDKDITIEVRVMEDGHPVEKASVRGGFERRFGMESGVVRSTFSDTNGWASVSSKSSGSVSVWVNKEGYYEHIETCDLISRNSMRTVCTNVLVELKPINNPIPMYVKDVGTQVPVDGKPVGYDLEKGDWVVPYGKGVKSDILYETEILVEDENNYSVSFNITFSGKFNGIQPMFSKYPKSRGSHLVSTYDAPEEGYQSSIQCAGGVEEGRYVFRTPFDGKVAGYYFRVRTELDENGNIKSARYGKIYGDFRFGRRLDTKTDFTFLYYYNPNKTRNVEFDPKHNLFLKNVRGRPKTCYSIGTP